jgi:phosphate acyltransferase
MAMSAAPLFRSLAARVDPRRYNGASLVGLQGIVIKSHGSADETAFATAIETAVLEARQGVPTRIGRVMADRSCRSSLNDLSRIIGTGSYLPERS